MNWIIENMEWIFSGVGATILTIILGVFINKNKKEKMEQNINSGNDSTNIQGGESININIGRDKHV